MDQHYIWSDGCTGQFKNARVFQWLCMLHKKLKVPRIWNYFESGHGKGDHDAEGACINRVLRGNEMKFTTTSLIRDAKSIVEWCSLVMGEGTETHEEQSHRKGHIHRYFGEVVDVDGSQWYECKTMQGNHGFHLVRTSNNVIVEIWTRKLSFFCGPCSINEWDDCESTD
jgi:hypothetical protein